MKDIGRFIIVSIGHNVKKEYAQKNILSIQKQNCVKNFFHIIINDGEFRNEISSIIPKFGCCKLIQNKERLGAENLKVISNYINSPNDIIILLPLQNWFADQYALQTIDAYYNYGNIVMYGGSIPSNLEKRKNEMIPFDILKNKTYREKKCKPQLPFIFNAGLFKYINMDMFKDENGRYLLSCYEIPLFYSLLDMVSFEKVKMLEKIAVENIGYIDNTYECESKMFYDVINENHIKNDLKIKEVKIPLEKITHAETKNYDEYILLPIKINENDIKKYHRK